jgi:hypothetical protein
MIDLSLPKRSAWPSRPSSSTAVPTR